MDFASQRARPSTARSRLSQGLGTSSFKEQRHSAQHPGPYMHSPGLGRANDSRVSLLSMAGPREDAHEPEAADAAQLSLEPAIKNIKSSRALSNQHASKSSGAGRPRSRTQSSEQGVVTVFSGVQEPPPLDPDLDALNKLPKYRPLVLAPSSNRLSGLFHMGVRYIEPTAEQLNLDDTELTGLCFSFRDFVSNRAQYVCDRQAEFVTAAKHIGVRAVETQSRLAHVGQLAKHEQDSLSVLKTLQRQAEKSYELIQDILHDLERLEAALPAADQLLGNESDMAADFPCLTKMLAQRRRAALPASHPHASVVLRRQIAARKVGIPSFPSRTSSAIPLNPRSNSAAYHFESAVTNSKARPGPYQLPGLTRQSSNVVPSRSHSKWLSDSRSLRPRGSRSSINSSDHSNSSAPVSPSTTDEARVSFDGEAIHPMGTASIAMMASQGTPRSIQRRSMQPFGSLRPPNSTRSAHGDYKGSYSRSEVSLSREQVVWSPQISTSANESAGYFHYEGSQPNALLADVEEEYSRCAKLVSADTGASDMVDNGRKSSELYPGPLSVPSDTASDNRPPNRRPSRMSISAIRRDASLGDKERSPGSDGSSAGNSRISGDYDRRPVISPGSARIPQLRVPLDRSAGSPASPKSLPHALSLRSASSLGSSPSASSMAQPTPIGSPSAHALTNQLSVVASPDLYQATRTPLSPQFPLEATRMLRQVIMEPSDGSTDARSASRCSTPLGTSTDCNPAMLSECADTEGYEGGPEQGTDTPELAGADSYQRSRASSMAASQLSATEGSEGADISQAAYTIRSTADSRISGDSIRGHNPWTRTNPERMSTWSSSSARTLADGMYGSRIPSLDDSSRAPKRPPSSALNTLTASAAMINRSAHGSSSSDRKGLTIHGGTRVAGTRPAIDLGLSIRSDLEHRVRSYSESGQNLMLDRDGRPHSSMGFYETVAGAPVWSARPDAIHARRHSPHSASLRHFRADKLNLHRLSMMSVGSQSSRQGPMSSGSAHSDGMQSDAASVSTSYSSQATDRLLPPSASQSTATGTIAGKRRAQTMDQS
ncbi:hypothetical protein LPJ63_004788 [Coemansia sp. RSA 2711]|nr:hypothetical protein LPJ63_004788 [Coemansia sp. RSA 2711]